MLKGQACPRCGGFARQEPGALRCLTCGHAPLFVSILPLAHWHPGSGYDRSNRIRQAALDRAFMNSGHVSEAIFDMLERLEGTMSPSQVEPAVTGRSVPRRWPPTQAR